MSEQVVVEYAARCRDGVVGDSHPTRAHAEDAARECADDGCPGGQTHEIVEFTVATWTEVVGKVDGGFEGAT